MAEIGDRVAEIGDRVEQLTKEIADLKGELASSRDRIEKLEQQGTPRRPLSFLAVFLALAAIAGAGVCWYVAREANSHSVLAYDHAKELPAKLSQLEHKLNKRPQFATPEPYEITQFNWGTFPIDPGPHFVKMNGRKVPLKLINPAEDGPQWTAQVIDEPFGQEIVAFWYHFRDAFGDAPSGAYHIRMDKTGERGNKLQLKLNPSPRPGQPFSIVVTVLYKK
jgi:hypothetical protein